MVQSVMFPSASSSNQKLSRKMILKTDIKGEPFKTQLALAQLVPAPSVRRDALEQLALIMAPLTSGLLASCLRVLFNSKNIKWFQIN